MPTLRDHTVASLRQALATPTSHSTLLTVVQNATGTVGNAVRKELSESMCDPGAAKRLCDMIDNKTGTISTQDIRRVYTALVSKRAADDFLSAVYTNAGGTHHPIA